MTTSVTRRLLLGAVLMGAASVALAADTASTDAGHQGHHPAGAATADSATSAAAAQPPSAPDTQALLDKMRQQMAQIQASQDPHERMRLMRAHMQSMREGIKAMGPGAGGEMHGMVHGEQAMMQRMHIVQGMMEQMLEHMAAMQAP